MVPACIIYLEGMQSSHIGPSISVLSHSLLWPQAVAVWCFAKDLCWPTKLKCIV